MIADILNSSASIFIISLILNLLTSSSNLTLVVSPIGNIAVPRPELTSFILILCLPLKTLDAPDIFTNELFGRP